MRIERIPENEKNAYAQVQIMNGTKKNVGECSFTGMCD